VFQNDPHRTVVVLGSGISGLLAAWACHRSDKQVVIIDRWPAESLPRLVPGCVYLHDQCDLPNFAAPETTLLTSVVPTHLPAHEWGDAYHLKVWGESEPRIPNSVDRLGPTGSFTTAYDLNAALGWLTDHFRSRNALVRANVDEGDVIGLIMSGYRVISSIPLGVVFPHLQDELDKTKVPVYVFQAPSTSKPWAQAVTLYNIDHRVPWYRMSWMFGNFSMEFNADPGPAFSNAFKLHKIKTFDITRLTSYQWADAVINFREHQGAWGQSWSLGRMLLVGRWSTWNRSYLSHNAYRDVLSLLNRGGPWSRS
jgi:hypothetical protein